MIRRVLIAFLRPRTAAETIVCNELVHELNGLTSAQAEQIRILQEQLWLWRQMARDVAVLASNYVELEERDPETEARIHELAVRLQDRVAQAAEWSV